MSGFCQLGLAAGAKMRQLDELVKVGGVGEGCQGWIWQQILGGKPLSIVP